MSDKLPYQKLKRHFHEPARLAVLCRLVHEPRGLPFPQLSKELDLTYGNLDRHLKVLSETGVIETEKTPAKRRPQTVIRLTADGRAAFLEYLENLEAMLEAAAAATGEPRKESSEASVTGKLRPSQHA